MCPVHGSERVRWVQSALNRIDGARLPVNGLTGRATREALRRFQRREGLPADGIAGPDTERALLAAGTATTAGGDDEPAGEIANARLAFADPPPEAELRVNRRSREYVRWVQRSLNRLMSASLVEDGVSGPRTRAAVRTFQRHFSLAVDGIVGPRTEAMLVALGFAVPPSTQVPVVPASGDWTLPPAVRVAGEAQRVRYDDPPAWSGADGCSRSLTSGAEKLRRHLLASHPGVSSIGGYNCRVNSANRSQTSVHGVGRALDIMIPTVGGRANAAVGDPIANWLVRNAERLGVQYLIWNRTKWNGSRSGVKHGRYGGPSPHTDHIHVELNRDGARQLTPWFRQTDEELLIA